MKKAGRRARFASYRKKLLCGILCMAMLSQTVTGFSAAQTAEEEYVYLKSSRIAQDKLPDGDLIYLGTASATVPEEGEYAIRIYREGNLDKKACVDLHTVDLTAVYGVDYELNEEDVEDFEKTDEDKSILEKYVKGQKVAEFDGDNSVEVSLGEQEVEEDAAAASKEKTADSEASDSEKGNTAADTSSLAAMKEEQTGEDTRELAEDTDDEDAQGLMDAITESLVSDAMENLTPSSISRITFEKGEREKTVRFSILEDDESEGTESFSLVLAKPEGAEIYEVGSAAITIEDDEERVKSEVSFSKSEYRSEDGKVILTVKRTGADYSVCDMRLLTSGDTAVAGENYEEKNQILSFAPYEMEKTIEMEVSGEGKFLVLLSELKACTEGEYIKATVNIAEEKAEEAGGKSSSSKSSKASATKSVKKAAQNTKAASNEEKQRFGIRINKKDYVVEYTMGDATGKILDEGYSPAVEAGVYYFSSDAAHGGIFKYGYKGGDSCKTQVSEYHYDTKTTNTMNNNYGDLKYYSTSTWKKGWAAAKSNGNIPGVYYQYLTSDWQSTSSFGGGQLAKFVLNGTKKSVPGKFGRTQDNAVIKNTSNQNLTAEIYAADETGWKTPKSYVEFRGICAMYRKYNIKVENPSALTYCVGSDSTQSMIPANITVKCGAQPDPLKSGSNTRDVYVNLSPDDTNFVFSIGEMSLNNRSGIYGYISGYQITLEPGKEEDRVTLSYPEDFKNYLKNEVSKKTHNANLDFSQTAVDGEIKKIDSNLNTVPYDAYFSAWIDSVQKAVKNDGVGYRQDLVFKPKMKYYDVKVEVLSATTGTETVKNAAHFKDSNLKTTGTKTYHAGDTLDLSVSCDDTDTYTVVGYEVSEDGGITYNTIRNSSSLFLQYDKKYKIRPVVTENSNAVEIRFTGDAKNRFEIEGLISQDKLKGTEFEGKNILNLNPNEKTVKKMAEPNPGQEYTVRVLVKSEDSTYAYRPTIRPKSGNTTYTTQYYSFVAAGQPSDNVIEVGVSKVKKSDLKKYRVKGTLLSDIAPIRQNGLAVKKLPVSGYTLSVGTGTQSTSTNKATGETTTMPDSTLSTTGEDGEYILSGITGVAGDTIPVLISNGIVNGQVVDVVLSDGIQDSDGSNLVKPASTEISYPYGAPQVTSIDYTYDKKENIQKQGGNTACSVHIYDDTFTITATVDRAGRTIKEAVFTVYHYGQSDSYDEYRVATDSSNPNVYECRIPKMPENFHNGDGIKIHLVDAGNHTLDVGKYDEHGNPITDDEGNFVQGQELAIEYPDRDTGLTFYTENELLAPQSYDLENSPAADVPLIGSATGNTSSGLLTFGKTNWAGNTGYTLQIGVDALINQTPGLTTEDKLKGYQKLHNTAQKVANINAKADEIILSQENQAKNAEEILNGLRDDPNVYDFQIQNLQKQKQDAQDTVDIIRNDATAKAKDAKAGMNKNSMWSVDVALVLAFDFVWNPEKDDYVFSCGTVAIGGTFTFNKTAYTVIYAVPAFINFTATMQANVTISYTTKEGQAALASGDFDSYVGNLADRLSDPKSNMSLMFSGKVQVGVGMCGVLSARGYASIKLQFDIPLTENISQGGFLINGTGGVGFDLLIISINFDIVNATYGTGTLKNKTKFDFFGGLLQVDSKSKKKAAGLTTSEEDTLLGTIGESERVVMHPYSGGTSDMSSFGRSGRKRATLTPTSVTTLLENAAERTRPQIISLGGDKKMIVFLANRAGGGEYDTALYYSVFDGSKWSEPKTVAEDGTTDSTPDILKVGNKIVIAWADAGRAFTEKDSAMDKLGSFGISVAVYDIDSSQMGQEVSLVNDEYFNLSPELNVDGTKFYCSYMKRDLSKLKKEEDLVDFTKSYSTMAYVTYDYKNSKKEAEKLISIKHDTITDPLVMDYTACTTVVDGDTYMLSTYTVDEDKDLNTNGDRELFLEIANLTEDRSYYPIQISHDMVSQGNPKLTDIDGTVYLTWLEDGYIFRLLDASDLVEALFDETDTVVEVSADEGEGTETYTIDKSKYINGYMTEQNENKDWYKKTAEDLDMDSKYYEDSIYEELYEGNLRAESANFSQNEDIQTSVGEYKLVTNGDDIYIFFTNAASEEDSAGVEIYGVRYQRNLQDDSNADESDTGDSSGGIQNEDELWGFGKAVQITHAGSVIDELDLYMTEDSRVHAVSNCFSQWIDEAGQIQYSKNNLVEIDFETKNSLEVRNGTINLPGQLVAGQTDRISFDVENTGLLTSKGFDYEVVQIADGKETEIASGHEDVSLIAGESVGISVPWTVPEKISATQIKVTVTETGVDNSTPYTTNCTVPYKSNLIFGDVEVLWEGQTPYVKTTVKNIGNAASVAYTGELRAMDDDGKETKIYQTFDLPALASGEEKTVELPFTPKTGDFNSLGIIKLTVKVMDGSKLVNQTYTQLVSSLPVCAQINDGKTVELKVNGKAKLKTVAAPWNGIAGEVKYYSSNAAVASVGDDGQVVGTGTGGATIYAYYPKTGITASIPVKVSDSGSGSAEATSKLKASKTSVVIAPGKTKAVKFTATKDASASKAASVKASISNKKVISKAVISGSKVKITAAKKAKKGMSANVTLKSVNAAGKTVKAKIKVTVMNKTKKLKAMKQTLQLKKGKKGKITLKVTAQNNKKPTTDTVKVVSDNVSLVKRSVKKGKIVLTLKGKKKGTKKATIKVGSKKVKIKVTVK